MKKLLLASLALALLAPALVFAQSSFTGSWKTDPSSIQGHGKPVVVTLKDGMFHCTCSNPPINVKADGQDHPVSGHPDYDMMAIKVVDNRTLHEVDKKGGKVVSEGTLTASTDGQTIINDFTNSSGSSPVTGKATYERVGKAMPGSNMVAGTWKLKAVDNISDNGLGFTYKIDGDTVNYSDQHGGSYTATLGGKAVPFHDANGSDGTVMVKKMGKNGMRETYMRDGKVTAIVTMTLAADGKSIKMNSRNPRTHRSSTSVAHRE